MNPGVVFGENIRTEKVKKRKYSDSKSFTIKSFLLLLFTLIAVSLLIGRLIYLQIFKGSYYRKLSDTNRIRTQIIYAPRGIIFDRNGISLALNTPGFRQIIKDPKNKIVKTILLNKEQALSGLAKGDKNIAVDSLREYPYKDIFAHVLGYIGQISVLELANKEYADYTQNDMIGKSGIEEQYEHLLRGKDGKQLIEIDAYGNQVRSLGQEDPVAGQDIKVTLDAKLQQSVYLAAKNMQKGAVIVTKPDGEILSLLSKPSYDPNLFTQNSTYSTASESAYQTISSLLSDSQTQPLLDRVISGTYPPGSTFKPIVASAGLENNIINEGFQIEDTGILNVGEFSFANWYYTEYGRKESGRLNVVRALARSNDIFFYKLAELIKVDKISEMAKKFGLGSLSGIDLPSEEQGIVPSSDWKEKNIHESWYLGDTYHYGIGQGFLLSTPLQINGMTRVFANGGYIDQPYLLKSLPAKKQTPKKIISANTIELIRKGMIESCSTGGVAWPLFDFKVKNNKLKIDGRNFLKVASSSADTRQISIACKTGTAQHGDDQTLPHAWITLFAPAYNPEIVITVLKESSGEGSNEAAPVAKKILEAYFSNLK